MKTILSKQENGDVLFEIHNNDKIVVSGKFDGKQLKEIGQRYVFPEDGLVHSHISTKSFKLDLEFEKLLLKVQEILDLVDYK